MSLIMIILALLFQQSSSMSRSWSVTGARTDVWNINVDSIVSYNDGINDLHTDINNHITIADGHVEHILSYINPLNETYHLRVKMEAQVELDGNNIINTFNYADVPINVMQTLNSFNPKVKYSSIYDALPVTEDKFYPYITLDETYAWNGYTPNAIRYEMFLTNHFATKNVGIMFRVYNTSELVYTTLSDDEIFGHMTDMNEFRIGKGFISWVNTYSYGSPNTYDIIVLPPSAINDITATEDEGTLLIVFKFIGAEVPTILRPLIKIGISENYLTYNLTEYLSQDKDTNSTNATASCSDVDPILPNCTITNITTPITPEKERKYNDTVDSDTSNTANKHKNGVPDFVVPLLIGLGVTGGVSAIGGATAFAYLRYRYKRKTLVIKKQTNSHAEPKTLAPTVSYDSSDANTPNMFKSVFVSEEIEDTPALNTIDLMHIVATVPQSTVLSFKNTFDDMDYLEDIEKI